MNLPRHKFASNKEQATSKIKMAPTASNHLDTFRCPNCGKTFAQHKSFLYHIDQRKPCHDFFRATLFAPTVTTTGAVQQPEEPTIRNPTNVANILPVDDRPDDTLFNYDGECNSENPFPNDDWVEEFPPHSQFVSDEDLQKFNHVPPLPPKLEFQYALYAMLNHPSIPLYIFPSVVRLLNSAICSDNRELILSSPFSLCRSTTQKEIEKLFPVPRAMSIPFQLRTKDNGMQATSLVVFDVKETILQEVQNPDLWKLDNLALNGNRWYQHEPACNQIGMRNLSHAISGEAYSRAYKKHVTEPHKQLFVPFGCWIDESGVTGNLRHPVQPLLVKCLLLKRAFQRNCILSYIPCATKSSAENKQDASSEATRGNNLRNFHAALSKVFKEWDNAANHFADHPQQVTLGRSTAQMTIVPVILFFLGDHKSQLMLSCAYSNSICSECDNAKPWLADDPHESLCQEVDTAKIRECNESLMHVEEQKREVEVSLEGVEGRRKETVSLKRRKTELANSFRSHLKKLKALQVVYCNNAFSSFKSIARPINHCTPADHLHVFLLGILKTCALCTLGNFTDKQKTGLDDLCRKLFKQNSSSARNMFPRFYIEKGMTNTGNLTGSEWAGYYFALFVVGRTDEGKMLIEEALPEHYQKLKKEAREKKDHLEEAIANCKEASKEGPNNMMNISKSSYLEAFADRSVDATYEQFMECIEQMLLLHAFATQKELWWSQDLSVKFDVALRRLIELMVFCFPRVEGDCHKYPKMHLLKHLTKSMKEYGAPINVDCMDGEKALQEFAKHLARTVKSVSDLTYFNRLLAKRLEEHLSVKKMMRQLCCDSTPFLQVVQKMMKHRQDSSFDDSESGMIERWEEEEEEEEEESIFPVGGKVVGLPANPHWWMSYRVEHLIDHSNGSILEDRGSPVCHLLQTDVKVFTKKKSEIHPNALENKMIPEMCCRALEEDLVKWICDVAVDSGKWNDFLPNHVDQKLITVQGYFSCKVARGKGKHHIRCDPNFLQRDPRYDFVAEEHVQDKVPTLGPKGTLEDTATPSKVLMLYNNPFDGELRAVTHPCEYNVRRGKKITEVYKTSEIYHLDMDTKPSLHNLLFTELGDAVALNNIPKECFDPDSMKTTCRAVTSGTQVSRLGAPMFCIQQHPGLLDDVNQIVSLQQTDRGKRKKERELTKVLCMRSFREHWPSWFCD